MFDLEPDNPEVRFNDGRSDPQGRFWVGGLIETMDRETNVLYRYDPDGNLPGDGGRADLPQRPCLQPGRD